jgi:hypothetical protein
MYGIFTFLAVAAVSLPDIIRGDWIFDCKLAAAPSPPLELR